MPKLIFDHITNHPQHIPLIAQWQQTEWQRISPHMTTESRIRQYSLYANTAAIPSCILVLANGAPVGSASLVESDMETHAHLKPWLASVFVDKQHRRQGIATQLIQHCIENAGHVGVDTLYLFTPDQANFYQKRGWKLIESCPYNGERVDIMAYDIKNMSNLISI